MNGLTEVRFWRFGLMNPAYRGGLIQSMLIMFMLMGSVAGLAARWLDLPF